MSKAEPLEIELFEAFEFLLHPKRIKVLYGGRGGAKSEEIAELLTWFAWAQGDKILCGREFQNSIEESSYALLSAKVEKFGLQSFFDVQSTAIYGRNDSYFKFVGLSRNITSLKSKFGFNKVWIEEAENVSENTWKVLIPTIREANSEIWISFNPNEADAPTYKRFIEPYLDALNKQGFYEDEYIYVKKVSCVIIRSSPMCCASKWSATKPPTSRNTYIFGKANAMLSMKIPSLSQNGLTRQLMRI